MKIYSVYYQVQNNNNYGYTPKHNQAPMNSPAPRTINFTGEDIFEKAKKLGNKIVDNAKESFYNFSSLFNGKQVQLDKESEEFLEDYLTKEKEIKDKYDTKIAKIKNGFWDQWFNGSEKKRQELRNKKAHDLAIAQEYQEIFEQREKEAIENRKQFYELAKQLNYSKEIIMAFEKAQAESDKRLAITQRRKEIMDKRGLSKIGGYTKEKFKLQKSFIDKLDDERAGKFLTEKIPNAILFYGPTGCGKTTFVKALAEETDCNYKTIQCRGSQKEKEEKLYNILEGYTKTDDFGDEVEVNGLLEKAQNNFEKTNKRTIILIDEFDRFFGNGVSNNFINYMKELLENSSRDYHVTFFLTSNKPQKIPYELKNFHRISPTYPINPPDKNNTISVIEYYLEGCETEDFDYDTILDELFKFAPDEVYSNSHLKTICELAADDIKPINEPLTTKHFLEAIKKYNESSDDSSILRITKEYLDKFQNDQENLRGFYYGNS